MRRVGAAKVEGAAVKYLTTKAQRAQRSLSTTDPFGISLRSLCRCGSKFGLTAIVTAIALLLLTPSAPANDRPEVIVVVGAAGEDEYAERFREWSESWRAAAKTADAGFQVIGEGGESKSGNREELQKLLTESAIEKESSLWLVLIGHGTYDGQTAKFNLRGSDLTAEKLAKWLAPVGRPLGVIDCTASSGPFLNRLAKENRVVITATRSGDEQNFAHFGKYVSSAIADPRADVDKDGQVSLLEAYLTACRDLDEFYKQEARLPTEHALLDDNGDGLGTPAAWFRGIRATQRAKAGASLDGTRAHQICLVASDREKMLPPEVRKRRDEIEVAIAKLREEKAKLKEDDYYGRLEKLMLELAKLYESNGKPQ